MGTNLSHENIEAIRKRVRSHGPEQTQTDLLLNHSEEHKSEKGIGSFILLCSGAAALLLVLFLIPSLASAATTEEQEKFKVENIKGKNAWFNTIREPAKKKLAAKQFLTVGDTIFTADKTTVRISLPDGSLIKIGSNTTFKITEVEGSYNLWQWTFQLLNGTVRALIRKATSNLGPKSKVRIKTPAGTAGVRGTDYVVSYSPEKQEVKVRVQEGSVWLGPSTTSTFDENRVDTELLISGYCSQAKSGMPPSKAERCSQSAVSEAADAGLFDDDMKFAPSRLPTPRSELDEQLSKNASAATFGDKDYKRKRVSKTATDTERAVKTPDGDVQRAAEGLRKLSAVLMDAVKRSDERMAVTAIDAGAFVDVRDADGNTPLMYAAKNSNRILIYALIRKGASINMQNNEGYTALMMAAEHGNASAITTLKYGKPNVHLTNKKGQTAEDLARARTDKRGKIIYKELRRWRRDGFSAILEWKRWAAQWLTSLDTENV